MTADEKQHVSINLEEVTLEGECFHPNSCHRAGDVFSRKR